MKKKHNPKSIDAIFSAIRSSNQAVIKLTEDEKTTISNERKKLLEPYRKSERDRLSKILQPWINVPQIKEEQHLLALQENIIKQLTAIDHPKEDTDLPPYIYIPKECYLQEIIPPYCTGSPEKQKTTETKPPGCLALVASSSLSQFQDGKLFAGVGVGKFQDCIYPATGKWPLGDYSSSEANIIHLVRIPTLNKITKVTVTVSIDAGNAHNMTEPPKLLYEGSASSTCRGLVGVMGWIYLGLVGYPSLESPRIKHVRFLSSWKNSVAGSHAFNKHFSISETLWLCPGASMFVINVTADVWALKTDDSGLAIINFTEGPALGLLLNGGPIAIPKISIQYCPFETLPASIC